MLRVMAAQSGACLLYTSDAADDLLCVDLGGRRIIKKKKYNKKQQRIPPHTARTESPTKLTRHPLR